MGEHGGIEAQAASLTHKLGELLLKVAAVRPGNQGDIVLGAVSVSRYEPTLRALLCIKLSGVEGSTVSGEVAGSGGLEAGVVAGGGGFDGHDELRTGV